MPDSRETLAITERLWRRLQLLSIAGAALLIGVGIVAYSMSYNVALKRDDLQHLNRLEVDFQTLSRLLVDLEAGQRGYFLTGEARYLEPYTEAQVELPRLYERLEAEFRAGDEELRRLYSNVQTGARHRIVELERTLEIEQTQGREMVMEFILTDLGKRLMDLVRQDLASLQEAVDRERRQYEREIQQLTWRSNLFMASLILLAILSSLSTFIMVRRYAAVERRAAVARERADVAQRKSREKSVFLANMSHEIRTPMNAIFGFAQLLNDSVIGERERSYAQAITRSGQVLLELINDILDISKIEAGKLELVPQPVNPHELLNTCRTLFGGMANEKGLSLSIEAAPGLPDSLILDPLRARQILINLIGNALKYTQEGSVRVALGAVPTADMPGFVDLSFEVTDTGIGISDEDRSRIFEPFVQSENASSVGAGGAGLGLSIVKRLVDLMGGSIRVSSRLDEGSQFLVHLPRIRVTDVPAPLPISVQRARLEHLPPLRILVVDDVELNRDLIEAVFADSQHRIVGVDNGLKGVETALDERPDVIFMDIRMPGISGVEAQRRIRALPQLAACKIIALTASSLLGEEGRLRQMFDGYLRKPVTREALESELMRLFGHLSETTPAPEGEEQGSQATWSEQELQAWSERRGELERSLERARATLSSDEVRALLRLIAMLPSTPGFSSLRSAGAEAGIAAETFDIMQLEKALDRIGALIRGINAHG